MKTIAFVFAWIFSVFALVPASQADQVREILNNFQHDMLQAASPDMQPSGVREILYPAPAVTNESAQVVRTVLNQFQNDMMQAGSAPGLLQPTLMQTDMSIREAVDLFGYRAPAAWPFGYPQPQPQYYAAVYYQMPYYTAPYYPAQGRLLSAEEVFGTRAPTPLPRPTEMPTPLPTTAPAAVQPAPAQPMVAQVSVVRPLAAAGAVVRRPAAQVSQDDAAELSTLDLLAYWTRKIMATGILLFIIGFAYRKKRAEEYTARRRIADLEDELHRLDRLIYPDERKGGGTP